MPALAAAAGARSDGSSLSPLRLDLQARNVR
jgi:hypothetical protein